jgi:hypothetical protein
MVIASLQPTRAHPEVAIGCQISGAKGAEAILGMTPNTLRS